MSNQLFNQFFAVGTEAERVAFIAGDLDPPASVPDGPDPLYGWFATDTGVFWARNFDSGVWSPVGTANAMEVGDASEALAADDIVNIFDSGGGTFAVRKADADDPTKFACGFVLAAVSMSDPATVYFSGLLGGQAGLTPGWVYLSATAGEGTSTAPSSAGQIVQNLGRAVSATQFWFNPLDAIPL